MSKRWAMWMVVLVVAAGARGQTTEPATKPTSKPAVEGVETNKAGDRLAVTEHSITVRGKVLMYKATAGTMAMKDESGKTKADMFFVAYTLEGADAAKRPVMFVFNGGPGAAAVWLHLGAVGPKKIQLDEEGLPPAPPYGLVDNEATWLDATDLVLIDPVGTGYSRPAQGENGNQFFGVKEDVKWVGDFIRLYTTKNKRWPSPKFLAGESYGTTRAAALSEHLLDRHGISLNGIVLISSVLDFQTLRPGTGSDLPYALYLPTYTATAWYHKKLPADLQGDLQAAVRESTKWAANEYPAALLKGEQLTKAEREAVAGKLARYSGLPVELVLRSHLRIDPSLFEKRLLEEQGKIIGRFDGRITGYSADQLENQPEYDPSLSRYFGVYSACINHYLRTDLKYDSDLPYEVLTSVGPWDWGHGNLYVGDALRSTMQKNPHLRVLIASGQMDLATPFFATEFTINHLELPEALRGNITQTFYPAGHMMYHNQPSLRALHTNVKAFIETALPGGR